MPDQKRTVRISRLKDQGNETDLRSTTAADRLAMIWPLTLEAWAFKGERVAKSRLQRHVVHLDRRGG